MGVIWTSMPSLHFEEPLLVMSRKIDFLEQHFRKVGWSGSTLVCALRHIRLCCQTLTIEVGPAKRQGTELPLN